MALENDDREALIIRWRVTKCSKSCGFRAIKCKMQNGNQKMQNIK